MRVTPGRRSGWAALAVACMACVAAAPASAMVTLQTSLSNITCGITTADGATLPGSCDTMSFTAKVDRGQTAFLRGTLNYHYTDDGLAIFPPAGIQGDANGFTVIPVVNEAAVLYFRSNDCSGSRYCRISPDLQVVGTRFDPPLVLGLNGTPDDITGNKELFVNFTVLANSAFTGYVPTLFVEWTPLLFSAPVPEPATFALMAAGLAALGFVTRRRRRK